MQEQDKEKLIAKLEGLVKQALHSEQDDAAKNRFAAEAGDMARSLIDNTLMLEAMRQATEDQRKVLDKWTANAQDPNKIYWKG